MSYTHETNGSHFLSTGLVGALWGSVCHNYQ